jgi:sarcosine oxidase, subunit gamma
VSGLQLQRLDGRALCGCKGPRAAAWLGQQGIAVPAAQNSYAEQADARDDLVVARLGTGEFFMEQGAPGDAVRRVTQALAASPAGVYPVLREDWALTLGGAGAEDVLAQVCNVNFAALDIAARPIVMTLMIGVAVLVVVQARARARHYRIWCDPTYGPSFSGALRDVVVESGGTYSGVTA